MSDLDVIDPAPRTVKFRGREVEIRPLKVGKLPAFARAVRPLMPAIAAFEGLSVDTLIELIADHGEQIVEAVSVATGIDRAELDEADVTELIALIAPVIEVNGDFFVRNLAPAMLAHRRKTTTPGAGPTP